MKLGNDLRTEQTQKLVMTPTMIQAVKILQLNRQELLEHIREELMDNPVLETSADSGEEHDASAEREERDEHEEHSDLDQLILDFAENSGLDDISYKQNSFSSDRNSMYENLADDRETLQEHLLVQLRLTEQDIAQKWIGEYIIESLDENGMMTSTAEEIATALKTCIENVRAELEIIRGFDPIGVCAGNFAESLLIQLDYIGEADEYYEKLLREHLDDLAARRVDKIAKSLGVGKEDVKHMLEVIRRLDPRPGSSYASGHSTSYVVPDMELIGDTGSFEIVPYGDGTPRLEVSSYYRSVLRKAQTEKDSEVIDYLSGRVDSAVLLIRNIEHRQQTIENVTRFAVNFQHEFFERGVKYLKPLTMKMAADELGIAESTVSRAINGKYIQTPRGVFELRYFFAGGVMSADGGISSAGVKSHIREIIEGENSAKPLSDQKIADMLNERGMDVSRRTVAKYREEEGIASSSRRKKI